MIQDQQQKHSSSSSQSPGSSIAVVLEAESCLVILWISHGLMMCFVCLLTSLDWRASVAVLDAAALSVPAPFYKEKSILGKQGVAGLLFQFVKALFNRCQISQFWGVWLLPLFSSVYSFLFKSVKKDKLILEIGIRFYFWLAKGKICLKSSYCKIHSGIWIWSIGTIFSSSSRQCT